MTSPLMHVQELLAADGELPRVHPQIYRGEPKEPALVLVGLGGTGLVGAGITPQRNIDSIRIEARAEALQAAERLLDRAVAVLRRSPRLVAVAGTVTDYDPATEIYRVFGTADIRR